VAVASLDLSPAFDVVNRELLHERMVKMGRPDDIVNLIKEWLANKNKLCGCQWRYKPLQKSIRKSSANALKFRTKNYTQYTTYTEIQELAE
jgi:hypothetical protein